MLPYLQIFLKIIAFKILEGTGINLESFCVEDHLDGDEIQEDFLQREGTMRCNIFFLTQFLE